MAVNVIFGYIFLGLSIILYGIGAYHSFKSTSETESLADDISDVLTALKEALDSVAKLGKGVQFIVFGTISAVIGLYLLTL